MISLPNKKLSDYGRGELGLYILGIVALSVTFAGIILAAPAIGALLKILKPRNSRERQKIERALLVLEKKKLITRSEETGTLKATRKGMKQSQYDFLLIQKRPWDKKWRLVMFDIPESRRPARIALSRKILEMGMRHVQDSIFISPYPCAEEIRKAVDFLRVSEYVQVATAIEISNSSHFKKEFGIVQ